MPFLASEGCFWPLAASMRSEVKTILMRFQKICSFVCFWPSEEGFWPLTASITSEVKNNCDHVTMKGILNKIRAIKFSIGCMV